MPAEDKYGEVFQLRQVNGVQSSVVYGLLRTGRAGKINMPINNAALHHITCQVPSGSFIAPDISLLGDASRGFIATLNVDANRTIHEILCDSSPKSSLEGDFVLPFQGGFLYYTRSQEIADALTELEKQASLELHALRAQAVARIEALDTNTKYRDDSSLLDLSPISARVEKMLAVASILGKTDYTGEYRELDRGVRSDIIKCVVGHPQAHVTFEEPSYDGGRGSWKLEVPGSLRSLLSDSSSIRSVQAQCLRESTVFNDAVLESIKIRATPDALEATKAHIFDEVVCNLVSAMSEVLSLRESVHKLFSALQQAGSILISAGQR